MIFKESIKGQLDNIFISSCAIKRLVDIDVVKIESSFKFTPKEYKKTYMTDIKAVIDGFYKLASDIVRDNTFFSDRYIIDYKVSQDNIKFGRISRFKYSLFFCPNHRMDLGDIHARCATVCEELSNYLYYAIMDNGFAPMEKL